ncbi:MAG: hypothetical protein NTU44_13145 [Bacteroidetes bacterium]|nr:hypothetical protein [Bacteroidota bacterium]
MKKTIFLLLLAFGISKSYCQTIDSLIFANCGSSAEYIQLIHDAFKEYFKKQADSTYIISESVPKLTLLQNFPSNQVVVCGHFKLYYEDFLHTPAAGFADNDLGQARRNTFCQVLSYFQSVFNIPAGDTLDLYIGLSYTPDNPAPAGPGLAQAGPLFPANFSTVPGVYHGYFYDHLTSGIDPNTNQYDGIFQVNFHRFYSNSLFFNLYWWNDTSNFVPGKYFDLYSVLLHELAHVAGWISNIKEDSLTHLASSNGCVTKYDSLFLYYGNVTQPANFQKLVTFNFGTPTLNPNLVNVNDIFRQNKIWMRNLAIPNNDPVYSGIHDTTIETFYPLSCPSHLADDLYSFLTMTQYSPGYYPDYGEGPFKGYQEIRRKYSLNELRYLHMMGYGFTSSFSNSNNLNGVDNNLWLLTQNHPPYRTNNNIPIAGYPFAIFDSVAYNFSLMNHNTWNNPNSSTITYNISLDNTLNDLESDQIKVFPGSLYGIRGVTDSTINNHNQLQILSNGTQIKYTPLPGFWGRAQYAFNLWDGHEKGSVKIITIDVLPDTSIINSYDELVINGNYEDGTEIRQLTGPKVGFPNTTCYDNRRYNELEGKVFSGGHPYLGGQPNTGNHYSILNSEYNAEDPYIYFSSTVPGCFGTDDHRFGNIYYTNYRKPMVEDVFHNERYRNQNTWKNLSALKKPLKRCHYYRISFDMTFDAEYFNVGNTINMHLIGAKNWQPIIQFTAPSLALFHIRVDSVFSHNYDHKWQQFIDVFTFCLNDTVQVFDLQNTGWSDGIYIDNLSIKELPPDSVFHLIQASQNPICSGESITLTAVSNVTCPASYHWSTNENTSSIVVAPSVMTTYYVTITDACGSLVNSITIHIALPAVSNPSFHYECQSDTIYLFSPGGLVNYIWWGPNNFGSLDQNPIVTNVTSTSTGWYYLLVYDSCFTSDIDSVYINTNLGNALIIGSNSPICAYDTIKLTTSQFSYYYWTGPNGFMSSIQNPLIINADTNNTGWYICNGMDTLGCHSNSIWFDVYNCCHKGPIPLFSNKKITSFSNPLPNAFAILGYLSIDSNTVFPTGTEIVILPSSKIDIWSNKNLEIENAHIHGCQQLWNTIYLQDFAGLILKGSLIEDGEYAVTVNEKPTLSIIDNHFHKNYIGLYVPEPNLWSDLRYIGNFTFSGNEFDCENDVLLNPYAGQISKAGVWLNSELQVSLYGNMLNMYHHMKNGILSYNTNLDVAYSKFYNIFENANRDGYGIYAESYDYPFRLAVIGLSTSDTTFKNCTSGIRAFRYSTNLMGNMMHNVNNGIVTLGSPYSNQDIYYNHLECNNLGILMLLNDPVRRINIHDNYLRMNSSSTLIAGNGITIYEVGNQPWEYTKVYNNYIIMDTCYFGIRTTGTSRAEIFENVIIQNKPLVNHYGITMDYCPRSSVNCNEVYGSGASLGQLSPLLPRGLKANETANSNFSCNYFSNTLIGASFENGCYGDSIRGNSFNNHYFGLYYNKYCTTGPQKHQGNMWNGSYYGNIGAKHEYDSNFYYVNQNLYRVKLGQNFVPPTWDPSIWFNISSDTSTYSCTYCPTPDSLPPHNTKYSELDYEIVNGLSVSEEFKSETRWLSSRYLFNKILSDTTSESINPVLQNFHDSIQNVSPGKFQKVDIESKQALNLEPINRLMLDSISRQVQYTLIEISVIDSLLRNTTDSSDRVILTLEKEMHINSLRYLFLQLSAISQGIKNVQESKINTVLAANGNLPSGEIYEQNEKYITDIYLNTVARGIFDLTEDQISLIAEVANQCPLAGGNAVYLARSLYALVHDTIYDDKQLCYLAGIKNVKQNKEKANRSQSFKLFPNPAKDVVTIEWQNTSDEFVKVEFITPIGQTYYQEIISLLSGKHEINLSKWKTGVYQVCFQYANNKETYCDKLVIIK